MEKALFHVMEESKRVVIFSMDYDGNRTVYCPGNEAPDEYWLRYSECKKHYLDIWFGYHVGNVVVSPYAEYEPGTPDYPRGLACVLTHNSLLDLWAYVTAPEILVSLPQVARAMGVTRRTAEEQLEAVGIVPRGNGNSTNRVWALGDIQRGFGRRDAGKVLLYSGQVADFLGVQVNNVPDIVGRLGLGTPDRSRVKVPWKLLRQVRRTGPRSFEVRNA